MSSSKCYKRSMKYKLLAVLTTACLGTAACNVDESIQAENPAATTCELTMGFDPWEPYQYRDIDSSVRGLDVELVERIAEQAGCQLSFAEDDWGSLLVALERGDIDVLAGATRTAGRERFARFTAPYRDENFALFIRMDDLSSYEGLTFAELLRNDLTVGLVAEYVYGEEVAGFADDLTYGDQFMDAVIPEVNYDRLLSFEIDALIDDPAVATAILRRRGLEDQLIPLDVPLGGEEVRLMLSRASVDDALAGRIDDALRAFRDGADYQQIVSRYRPGG